MQAELFGLQSQPVAAYNPQSKPTSPKQHSPGHIDGPKCEELRQMVSCPLSPALAFEEAAPMYMRKRSLGAASSARKSARKFLQPTTVASYEQYIRSLNLFFGPMPLNSIHEGHVWEYQAARLEGREPFVRKRRPHEEPGPLPCKPKQIDKEIGLLKMILASAGCSSEEMNRNVGNLPDDESDGELPRALSPEEQEHWLAVARSKERWALIWWYSIVGFNTCSSTDELRALRLGDVNLHHRTIYVRRGKCKGRRRTIPIEDGETLWALERLVERAEALGASDPLHKLFPFRPNARGKFDVTRAMTVSGLKRLWQEVRDESGLLKFRMYDTRHTGITRLAEDGVPMALIMARAGHLSPRMTQHYTQVSESAQRRRLRAVPSLPSHASRLQVLPLPVPVQERKPPRPAERPGYTTIYIGGVSVEIPA